MECYLEVCENCSNNICSVEADNLIPNHSSCSSFLRNLKKTKRINIVDRNAFLLTAIRVNDINYIFQGDVEPYINRLEYYEDGKTRLKK